MVVVVVVVVRRKETLVNIIVYSLMLVRSLIYILVTCLTLASSSYLSHHVTFAFINPACHIFDFLYSSIC